MCTLQARVLLLVLSNLTDLLTMSIAWTSALFSFLSALSNHWLVAFPCVQNTWKTTDRRSLKLGHVVPYDWGLDEFVVQLSICSE